MNNPNEYVYQDQNVLTPGPAPGQTPAPGGPAMPSQYRFSPEELRVLGECNRESFMQRSLPLATTFGLGTLVAVQKGHLRPNPRFGPFPKVTLAVMVGYFLGKLSYQQACAEKLMALPGSYIGQLLRERRDGKIGGTNFQRQGPTMFGATQNDIYSDAGPGNSLNLDTERPLFSDDSYRPDNDVSDSQPNSADKQPQQPVLSYDELRKKNRGQYNDSKQDPYRLDPGPIPPVTRTRPAPLSPSATNKYGDPME